MQDLNSTERLRWERSLVRRAQEGDRRAFAELYEAYAGLLFARVLLPRLGQHTAAEDALAETFQQAFRRLDSFEPAATSIYFWFARIAKNKALDMHRARGVTGRGLVNLQALFGPLEEAPLTPELALDEKQRARRLRDHVQGCLEQLNPRYRQAIVLRFFDNVPREQCAVRMEVKLGTFDVLLLRALRAFRKSWDEVVKEMPGV